MTSEASARGPAVGPNDPPDRRTSFVIVGIAYAVAWVAAWFTARAFGESGPWMAIAMADLVATGVIFAFSVGTNNSSLYDAYWSVAPVAIVLHVVGLTDGPWLRDAVWVLLIGAYGARLTWNWARGWPGLHHEDWRYVDLRRQTGRLYWIVSGLGLHLFPTVMVFFACVPLFPVPDPGAGSVLLEVLGALVLAAAIAIEALADEQLRAFRRMAQPGEICDVGLWAWSRHPNYFGEIAVWVGVLLLGVGAGAPWSSGLGALLMILMFVFVSLPLAERRAEKKPAWAGYRAAVPSILVPMPPRVPARSERVEFRDDE